MTSASPVILLAAVEPSGDALGAALYAELKALLPDARFIGCGGSQMAEAGFTSAFDIGALAVMGFTDVIKVIPEGLAKARDLAQLAAREQADIAIFIDGWTFSRIGAKRLREYAPDTTVVKYAAPQIWASRPQRIDFVVKYFDAVLTLLPFEPPLFTAAGVPAAFVGNSNFERVYEEPSSAAWFRQHYGLNDGKVLLVLPGSRQGEVTRLAVPFIQTVRVLREADPTLQVIMAPARSVAEKTRDLYAQIDAKLIDPSDRYHAFAVADAALAASGTVVTEVAIKGTPVVVAYKVDDLTYFWAQRVMTADFVTILNIAAGREIIPEYLQTDCTAELLIPAVESLLYNEAAAAAQRSAVAAVLPELGGHSKSAARQAAEAVLAILDGQDITAI